MESSEKKELSARQKRLIAAILTSDSYAVAVLKVRVARSTLYAWLQDETFKGELQKRLDAILDAGFDLLKSKVEAAAQKLVDGLNSESENTQQKSARSILDYAVKIREFGDLETRLSELERTVSQQQRGKKL